MHNIKKMIIDFNKIYVIESLPADEIQTGTNLHNDIINRRLWNHEKIESELCIINSKEEFYNLLNKIERQTLNSEVIPYLHFEIHGNPDGLFLNSAEQINWYEIRLKLIKINTYSKNKLWISLASCHGAYLYINYSLVARAPFYGYIGSWKTINVEDLSASFERYFEKLLEDFNIEEAVEALNLYNPNLPVEYKLFNSRDVFIKAYNQYEANTYTEEGIQIRINRIAELSFNDPKNKIKKIPKAFFKNHAKRELLKNKENYRKDFYEHFLMIDLYPEIRDRFE